MVVALPRRHDRAEVSAKLGETCRVAAKKTRAARRKKAAQRPEPERRAFRPHQGRSAEGRSRPRRQGRRADLSTPQPPRTRERRKRTGRLPQAFPDAARSPAPASRSNDRLLGRRSRALACPQEMANPQNELIAENRRGLAGWTLRGWHRADPGLKVPETGSRPATRARPASALGDERTPSRRPAFPRPRSLCPCSAQKCGTSISATGSSATRRTT